MQSLSGTSGCAATRKTAELAAEDSRLGASLKRLLGSLDLLPRLDERSEGCLPPLLPAHAGYVTLFSYAAFMRRVPPRQALLSGFGWAWLENQLAVACKTIPWAIPPPSG